jgi:hypothetical protein
MMKEVHNPETSVPSTTVHGAISQKYIIFILSPSSALKMDTVCFSYEKSRSHCPQDHRHPYRCENLKKLKLSQYTPRRRLGESRNSSYSFTTSALDGGEWLASRPGRALAPGKGSPVPIVQEAGWAPEPVWTQRLQEKSFRLCQGSKLDRPVVQPVARQCTDSATRLIGYLVWEWKIPLQLQTCW